MRASDRSIANQVETKVTHLRLTGGWPVDLVDDAVSDRGPQARSAQCGTDVILVARGPGRRNARAAKRRALGITRGRRARRAIADVVVLRSPARRTLAVRAVGAHALAAVTERR